MTATSNEQEAEGIVASIKHSKKYQDVYEGTIRKVVQTVLGRYKTSKETEKAARQTLHEIVALYLGDPDYDKAAAELKAAFESGDKDKIKTTCAYIMAAHISSEERLPILDDFYAEVFRVTGQPDTILDVACALNPLAFPWMELPTTTKYYAYDIHEERVEFINYYFSLQGLSLLARVQDVAIQPPEESGDVALFLKELPRYERNYGGGLGLLEALRADYLVVSFPTVSLHGGRSLTDHYRKFFYELVQDKSWGITELQFESELVFCCKKSE